MSRPVVILAAVGILLARVSAAAVEPLGVSPPAIFSPAIHRLSPQDLAGIGSLVPDPLGSTIAVTPSVKIELKLVGTPAYFDISRTQVISATTSLGLVFSANGTESLISSVANLPTILTDLPGLVALAPAEDSLQLTRSERMRRRALVALELVSALYALGVAAYFGFRTIARLRKDAALRAKGLRRVRRKKRRHRAKKPRRSQFA